jgi:hypothetical protein
LGCKDLVVTLTARQNKLECLVLKLFCDSLIFASKEVGSC